MPFIYKHPNPPQKSEFPQHTLRFTDYTYIELTFTNSRIS
jgi:hypothetical protein